MQPTEFYTAVTDGKNYIVSLIRCRSFAYLHAYFANVF